MILAPFLVSAISVFDGFSFDGVTFRLVSDGATGLTASSNGAWPLLPFESVPVM